MWEGDGSHWTLSLEGGHVWEKVGAGGGGGGLHGVEHGCVGQDGPGDGVWLLLDCSSTGSSWGLGTGLADGCIVVGLGTLGAGLPEGLAVLLAAGLAGIPRMAGTTMTALGVGGWSACTRGLLLLLQSVVGGLGSSDGVGVVQGGEGGRGRLLCCNVVNNVHQVLQLAVLGPGEHSCPDVRVMHALEEGLHYHVVPVGVPLGAGGAGTLQGEVAELSGSYQPAAEGPDRLLRGLGHGPEVLHVEGLVDHPHGELLHLG